jgi:DNA polymerase I
MTLADADEIVLLDFEFIAGDGERPRPLCFVARELRSGRLFRQWTETEWPTAPPFAHGPQSIAVAYYASAEWGCYKALGWELPKLTIDLYPEFRILTNGLSVPGGKGLLGALQWFGLGAIEGTQKDFMRKCILAGGPYGAEDRESIMNYCQSDVDALASLLPRLIESRQNLIPALWRGAFMKVAAEIEWAGVPVDATLYQRMVEHWPELQKRAIARVNEIVPVYEGRSFRMARFVSWLDAEGLLDRWPRTADGAVALDEDTFRRQAVLHQELEPLRQTRQMLGQLKHPGLTIGSDGRNRCLLSAFGTITGRNKPSTTKSIFGCPSWMRGLIQPEAGTALAYCDWSNQEFGIAAFLSGDPNMQAAYRSPGDCYLAFARQVLGAGAVPVGATKKTHPEIRRLFKSTTLGTQYQISATGLAYQLEITLPEAEDLLDHHRRLFPRFWQWSDSACDYAQLFGELTAAFGWRMQLSPTTKMRTLRNFPLQGNASEMLRLGCVFAAGEGVRIVALVHDALLIEAPDPDIEHAVHLTERAMRRASESVLAGYALRSDAAVIRHPERFQDDRGQDMWGWITEALATL